MRPAATWIVVLDASVATAALRAPLRRLPLDPAVTPRPAAGDRIALLTVRGPLFVAGAEFAGTADVRADAGDALAVRHRVLAPPGHAVPLSALPSLRVAAGWTHGALGGLRGSIVHCEPRDHERIEATLLAAARAYGPRPRRPAHRRPRTPARRALIAGRAAQARRPA